MLFVTLARELLLLLPALLQVPATGPVAEPPQAGVEAFRPELEALLARHNDALRERSARDLKRCYDFERVLEVLEEIGAELPDAPSQRKLFAAGLAAGFCQEQIAEDSSWERVELRRIDPGPRPNEVVIVTRSRAALTGATFTRWWALRSSSTGAGWRFYDVEDLDVPFRFTSVAALLLAEGDPSQGPLVTAFGALQEAGQAVLDQDFETAGRALARCELDDGPDVLLAMHALIEASTLAGLGRSEEALAANDRAAAHGREMPVLLYQRAALLNTLGAHEQALVMARAYEEALGPDCDTYWQIGLALQGLGRDEEARAAHRAGLADDPSSVDNLLALVACLEPDAKGEVGEHFARFTDRGAAFDLLADEWLEAREHAALAALIEALRALDAHDPRVEFWAAELRCAAGEPWKAAELLAATLPRVTDADWRESYASAFADHSVEAGRELDGYLQAPERDQAFRSIAAELFHRGEPGRALALVERRRADAPQDPWLAFYEGQALGYDPEQRDRGLERLAEGHRSAPDEYVAECYREVRVDALHGAGRWLEAWEHVGPREATRAQLLELCLDYDDTVLLMELLARWSAAEPEHPELARWRAHGDFLAGRYAESVATILASDLLASFDHAVVFHLEADLVRGLVRLGRFDEAMEHARRSTERDGDPYFEIIVLGARGDVRATCAAIEAALDRGYVSATFYEDVDLGPLLRGPDYAAFRARYPVETWDEDSSYGWSGEG